jgi:hypothetical protein
MDRDRAALRRFNGGNCDKSNSSIPIGLPHSDVRAVLALEFKLEAGALED